MSDRHDMVFAAAFVRVMQTMPTRDHLECAGVVPIGPDGDRAWRQELRRYATIAKQEAEKMVEALRAAEAT